jgi:hypothetical protein
VLVWYRSGGGSDLGSTAAAASHPDTIPSSPTVADGELGYRP